MTAIRLKTGWHGVLAALFLLLAGQVGAQWHSYAHGGGANARELRGQPVLLSHGACSDCLGFSPLLSAAGVPAAHPPLQARQVAATPAARLASLLDDCLILAFRSRAPPR